SSGTNEKHSNIQRRRYVRNCRSGPVSKGWEKDGVPRGLRGRLERLSHRQEYVEVEGAERMEGTDARGSGTGAPLDPQLPRLLQGQPHLQACPPGSVS